MCAPLMLALSIFRSWLTVSLAFVMIPSAVRSMIPSYELWNSAVNFFSSRLNFDDSTLNRCSSFVLAS